MAGQVIQSEGMEVIDKQFAVIVTDRLHELHWSRSDLARAMRVSPQYVTDYLNGRSKPGPDVIERFFSALGLRPTLSYETISEPQKVTI